VRDEAFHRPHKKNKKTSPNAPKYLKQNWNNKKKKGGGGEKRNHKVSSIWKPTPPVERGICGVRSSQKPKNIKKKKGVGGRNKN
jgi:hypothetical protein